MKKLFLAVGFMGLLSGCNSNKSVDCVLDIVAKKYTMSFNGKETKVLSFRSEYTTSEGVSLNILNHYDEEGLTTKVEIAFSNNGVLGHFISEEITYGPNLVTIQITGVIDNRPTTVFLSNRSLEKFIISGRSYDNDARFPSDDILNTYRIIYRTLPTTIDMSSIYATYDNYEHKSTKSLKEFYIDYSQNQGDKFVCTK